MGNKYEEGGDSKFEDFLVRSERLIKALERAQTLLAEQAEGSALEKLSELRVQMEGIVVKLLPLERINLGILERDIQDLKKKWADQESRKWQITILVLSNIAAVAVALIVAFVKH